MKVASVLVLLQCLVWTVASTPESSSCTVASPETCQGPAALLQVEKRIKAHVDRSQPESSRVTYTELLRHTMPLQSQIDDLKVRVDEIADADAASSDYVTDDNDMQAPTAFLSEGDSANPPIVDEDFKDYMKDDNLAYSQVKKAPSKSGKKNEKEEKDDDDDDEKKEKGEKDDDEDEEKDDKEKDDEEKEGGKKEGKKKGDEDEDDDEKEKDETEGGDEDEDKEDEKKDDDDEDEKKDKKKGEKGDGEEKPSGGSEQYDGVDRVAKGSESGGPDWDGVAPGAKWNGIEDVNADDKRPKNSKKPKPGTGVVTGKTYSGSDPYETMMDVDFIIDSNPSRARGKSESPRSGAKSRPAAATKGAGKGKSKSPRSGAKTRGKEAAKAAAKGAKAGAKAGAKEEAEFASQTISRRHVAKTAPKHRGVAEEAHDRHHDRQHQRHHDSHHERQQEAHHEKHHRRHHESVSHEASEKKHGKASNLMSYFFQVDATNNEGDKESEEPIKLEEENRHLLEALEEQAAEIDEAKDQLEKAKARLKQSRHGSNAM